MNEKFAEGLISNITISYGEIKLEPIKYTIRKVVIKKWFGLWQQTNIEVDSKYMKIIFDNTSDIKYVYSLLLNGGTKPSDIKLDLSCDDI